MGWLDDARKKAEDKAKEAKTNAQAKAAEAAVAAAGAAVKSSVGGFFESIVSSAEASLASAEEAAQARGAGPAIESADDAAAAFKAELEDPTPDPLGDAVRAMDAPAVPIGHPTPPSSEPFADAYAAIRMAREARGLDPHGPPEPELSTLSPAERVEAALAAAAEAREHAAAGGSRGLAAEASARDQLAALKAARGRPVDDEADEPNSKKRTL